MGRRSPSSTWTTRYGFVLECSVLGVPMPPLPALMDGGQEGEEGVLVPCGGLRSLHKGWRSSAMLSPHVLQVLTVSGLGLRLSQGFTLQWL